MNHVGYELAGPKRFVCRSGENLGPSGRFEIIDGTGRTLLEGAASRLEPAGSGGPWHYRGEFSAFREAGGDFQVRFDAAGRIETSRRFGVGSSILRRLTMPLVLQFLRSRRFARANYRGADEWTPPGVLPEDEHFYDTGGGWFDVPAVAAASMRTGARAMWALFLAHRYAGRRPIEGSKGRSGLRRVESSRAGATGPDRGLAGSQALAVIRRELPVGLNVQIGESLELRELRRGADWLKRLMIRYPESGIMISGVAPGGRLTPLGPDAHAEPHLALLAGYLAAEMSEALADHDLLRRGELFWEEYHDGLGGIGTREAASAMLMSETALHVATLEPTYLAAAERRVKALLDEVEGEGGAGGPDPEKLGAWETPGVSLPAAALAEFADSFPDNPLTPRAKEAVGRFLDARVEAAGADPFGLVPHAPGLHSSGLHGDNAPKEDLATLRAGEAWLCLAANRVTGRPAYVELATNAMDWILGLNAEDACLLVGVGTGDTGADEGAVLAASGAEATSAHTGAAAAYLMALALI